MRKKHLLAGLAPNLAAGGSGDTAGLDQRNGAGWHADHADDGAAKLFDDRFPVPTSTELDLVGHDELLSTVHLG